jgi:FlaA1/EpsC-like NDP-sugar epimerase
MIKKIINLPRIYKQITMMAVDIILVIVVLLSSFSMRLGLWFVPDRDLIYLVYGAPFIAYPIFYRFGLYRSIIRYIDFKSLWQVLQAVSLYALVWGIISFMAAIDGLPRSVILINWVLAILIIGGLRVLAHAMLLGNFEILEFNHSSKKNKTKRSLIYGAGDAGVQLSSALKHSSEFKPVGFIDDDKDLQGNQIRGLNIYSLDEIHNLINLLRVDEVLLAMPSISRTKRANIINKLESFPVIVRILPGLSELARGSISISDLRDVSMTDLLGRDSVEPNKDLLGRNITNKVVMVTGAGGSIGSELARQIQLLAPKTLILFEVSEVSLYSIEQELLRSKGNDVKILPILGNINNNQRLLKVLKKFQVDTIYHAAAYKHVPMVEFNNIEGVENNIFGTLNCAQAAISAKVQTFVSISTDKAVRPTNTMGATKRFAELILQSLSKNQSVTKFSIVRFGNVLGSSGSVIPLFKQQIKDGGPITVTDPDIIRYFMTISEAVQLVIQSGSMGEGGDVFVLDMGEPVKINDLAEKMIKLTGLELKNDQNPNGDIEIQYTGLRPGEKLFEELLIGGDTNKTDHPLIMQANEEMLDWNFLQLILNDLRVSIDEDSYSSLRNNLIKAIPSFDPQCEIMDFLYVEKK